MRGRFLWLAGMVAFAAGCSQEPAGNASSNGSESNLSMTTAPDNFAVPDANMSASAPTGEEGMRTFAECSATLQAVANLFDAIASTQSGPQAEEARNTAMRRRGAASLAELRARSIAIPLGRPADEVAGLKRGRQQALERERAGRDFADFAIWLGREADRCAALDPSFR